MPRLPSGKYRVKLYLYRDKDGKEHYKSFTADTEKKAQKLALQWQAEHIPEAGNPTLKQACDIFLANRAGTLSPATYRTYNQSFERLEALYPDLFKMHLQAISSERIQQFVSDLSTRKHSRKDTLLNAKTVIGYYSVIDTVLRTNGVTLRNIKLPQLRRPELVIPEEETIRQLLVEIRGTDLEIPVLLAALGPMRRGEICALRMEDIDFEKHIVHVRRTMVLTADKDWIVKVPKTEAGQRDIEFPAYVTDLIREHGCITSYRPDVLTHRFVRTLEKKGFRHFRFHDLRHYAASFLLALGIPPVYVMERGGWNTEMSMKRYIHALNKQKKEYADLANAAFTRLF
ncbi:MAG: site-specific integrase [Lachnospiraceae bacterium]|nr:site-specific integrase [Lachnospiraceae bacterium]